MTDRLPSVSGPRPWKIAALAVLAARVFLPAQLTAQDPQPVRIEVDSLARSISIPATLRTAAFHASTPPDDRYHALVHSEGGAAPKALLVTPVSDARVARVLRELGALDGGGVPMAAWNLRWLPLIPQPARRVRGTPVEVTITWEGASRPYTLEELLHDPGGRGVSMRFGGNEVHDDTWMSGCILCLFSCPGGVVSNAAYSIRDHERERTTFEPGGELPSDGTPVTVTLALAPG